MPRWRKRALLAVLGLPVASCAGQADRSPRTASPSAVATTTTTSFDGSTTPVFTSVVLEDEGGSTLLADARLATQDGFDRFVLEFEQAVPGSWAVAYLAEPDADECESQPIQGTVFLSIATYVTGISDLQAEPVRPSYTGPRMIRSDTSVIREAVLMCVFEARMTWVLGLDAERRFLVTTLPSPARLVIDLEAAR